MLVFVLNQVLVYSSMCEQPQPTPQHRELHPNAIRPRATPRAPCRRSGWCWRSCGSPDRARDTVAPNIPPIAIAKAIIGRDFDARDCPTVTLAERISDGTIAADCSNGERFRIFIFQGKTLAMRCSAVRDLVLKALCGVPIDAGIKEMGPSFIYGPRRTPRRPVTSRGGF